MKSQSILNTTTDEQHSTTTTRMEDPTTIGIPDESQLDSVIDLYNHETVDDLTTLLQTYDDHGTVSINNPEYKAQVVFELLSKSQAVLVEAEPWLVDSLMTTDDFTRWEPFFIAFPERAWGTQMKFSNLAPLSEVHHVLTKRDTYYKMANGDEKTPANLDTDPITLAQMFEQQAFTRHELSSFISEETVECDPSGDTTTITAIHACPLPYSKHLILGRNKNNALYGGRGPQFDPHVDIAIDVDREINDYGERKVAIYNDKANKDALNSLDFSETHAEFLPKKSRWKADLSALETLIKELTAHKTVNYISINRITEKAYLTHFDADFLYNIPDYPFME